MGLNQSKLPSPAGGIQIGSLMCTLPPASNYTLKSAVEEGQKAIINHEVQLHQLQKMQESQSIINQTAEVRLTDLEQKRIQAAQQSGDHENRIIQLEERLLGVNFPGDASPLNNEEGVEIAHREFKEDRTPASDGAAPTEPNLFQNLNQFHVWEEEIFDAGYVGSPKDEPQVRGESRVHQGQGRKIQCEYCPKMLSDNYISQPIKLYCPNAPMHKRAVRRGVCPHCQKDLSVQSLKRHLTAPGLGGWN